YNWAYISKENSDFLFHFYAEESNTIQVSNGTYRLNFSNDANWSGDIIIDGDQTIQLPTEPTELEFTHFNANSYQSLWINYDLALSSGQFRMNNGNPVNDVKFEILDGTEKVY